jgi:hypothetical protein
MGIDMPQDKYKGLGDLGNVEPIVGHPFSRPLQLVMTLANMK